MNRLLRLGLAATIFGAVLVGTVPATAQIERQISYQGLLTQANGTPLTGAQNLGLRLYDAPTGGNLVWEEVQTGVTVTSGLFNVYLGSVNSLAGVNFEQQLYLEVALQGSTPFLPRTRLAVVPYAIRAERALVAGELDGNATNVVRTVNGQDGNITILGENGITVTTTGDTVRISANITVTGITTLASPQGTILITNPTGPTAGVDVRDGAISTTKLADNAVTTEKLANGSVTAAKLAAGLLPTSLPPSGPAGGDLTGSYPNPLIANSAVTTAKIADGAVTTGKLGDGSVTNGKLADGSVSNAKIVNSAVSTDKIQDAAVTSAKMSATGVTAGTYGSSLMVPRITVDAAGRVTSATTVAIPDIPFVGPAGGDLTGSYPNPTIRPSAVDNSKLADNSVSTGKLQDNSVTGAKILNGTITANKLAPGVIPTTLPPSGPAAGDLTGTYPAPVIANGAVTDIKIADGAVIPSKIPNNSITSAKITDGTIQLIDIAPGVIPTVFPPSGPAGGDLAGSTYPNPIVATGAITATKIADGAVIPSKIPDNSISSAKITDGTIQLNDIAPGVIPTVFPPSGPAGGVLNGNYPNPGLALTAGNAVLAALNNGATVGTISDARLNLTGVAPGTYGSGALIPVINVDVYGRVTSVSTTTVTSATPSGPAGGDLTGTYPAPILNPTAAAGGRMVEGLRNAFLGGNPQINTPNNVVVLDGTGRLPAVNGSLLTNLNANAISSGVLPIQFGGTNSNTALVNGRLMVSNAGRIVEGPALAPGQFFVGPNPGGAPALGTITAGAGINVTFTSPNYIVSSTDARILPGTANDQTVRWDALNQQWVPNANLLASAGGNVTANGSLTVQGLTTLNGNTALGTAANGSNSFGSGSNSTNSIGSTTATNWVYGLTNINTNTDGNTNIGTAGAGTSSTTINVGAGGNLTLNGISTDVPTQFVTMNGLNQVRRAMAASLALEGLMWQNGAFRLGGNANNVNPLLSTRFINLDNQDLVFTRFGGASTMLTMSGGANSFTLNATTNINTTGALVTTIGNPTALTTIGGQLDPRGIIRNNVGNVVIFDATEIIGYTQVNIGTDDDVDVGNILGVNNQTINLSVGQGAGGNLTMNNIKNDPTPLRMVTLNAMNQTRTKLLADMAEEGIQYQNGAFRLGAGASMPLPLRSKPYLENRFVNLDQFAISFTNGNAGLDGVTFFELDGNVGGAPRVQATALTNINVTGAAATNIGNIGTGGAVTVLSASTITNQSGTAYSITSGSTTGITVGSNYTLNVTGSATETIGAGLQTLVTGTVLTQSTGTNTTNVTGGNIAETASGNITMNATNVNSTATNNVNVTATASIVENAANINSTATAGITLTSPLYTRTTSNNGVTNVTNNENITVGGVYALTAPTANINATTTGNTQIGNGLGGVLGGRVGVGGVASATTITAHGAPVNANILLDVNGTAGLPNTRVRSLGANHPTAYNMAIDGVVIADNNGTLRRVPETNIIDANNGLTYNETGVDFDVRLGTLTPGNAAVANRPLQANRFVNLDVFTLSFNRTGVADNMLSINALTDAVLIDAATASVLGSTSVTVTTPLANVNTTGAGATNIGSTATGGAVQIQSASSITALAPTININATGTNATNIGAIGATNTVRGNTTINSTGTNTTQIGNGVGAGSNIGIGEPAIGTHLVSINGTAQTAVSSVPNVRIDHLAGASLTTAYADVFDNGVVIGDANGDLRKWDENTFLNPLAWRLIGNTTTAPNNILGTLNATDIDIRTNNLTRATVAANGNITIGNAATGGNVSLITTGANAISVQGTTTINTIGATNTTIGNGGSTTAINGPTNINNSQNFNTQINTGTSTGTITLGNALAGVISATSAADIILTSAATVDVNAVNVDVDATTNVTIDAPTTSINTAAAGVTNIGTTAAATNVVQGLTSINASINANTNINTGTSTGNVAIGNAAAGAISATSSASITALAPAININQSGAGAVTIGSNAAGAVTVESGASITAAAPAVSINATGAGTTDIGTSATAGNVTIGSSGGNNNTTLQARNGGDVVVDVDNPNVSDMRILGLDQAIGTEDVLMITDAPASNVRRYSGTPGIVFTPLNADYTYVQPAAQAAAITSPVINAGRYEVEVVLYYTTTADNVGLGEFGFIDFNFGGTATIGAARYGLAGSSGQALVEPSSEGTWGNVVQNIGCAGNPTVAATAIIKGTMQVGVGGTITFLVGEDVDGTAGESVTLLTNSYMKLTRVGP